MVERVRDSALAVCKNFCTKMFEGDQHMPNTNIMVVKAVARDKLIILAMTKPLVVLFNCEDPSLEPSTKEEENETRTNLTDRRAINFLKNLTQKNEFTRETVFDKIGFYHDTELNPGTEFLSLSLSDTLNSYLRPAGMICSALEGQTFSVQFYEKPLSQVRRRNQDVIALPFQCHFNSQSNLSESRPNPIKNQNATRPQKRILSSDDVKLVPVVHPQSKLSPISPEGSRTRSDKIKVTSSDYIQKINNESG